MVKLINFKCACGQATSRERTALNDFVMTGGWTTLPGPEFSEPTCPNPELLPAEIRKAASDHRTNYFPAKCPNCR